MGELDLAGMAGSGKKKNKNQPLSTLSISFTYFILFSLSCPFFTQGADYRPVNALNSTVIPTTYTNGPNNVSGLGVAAGTVSYRKDGDFVLGGLFNVHLSQNGNCVDFNPRGLQWLQAMVYAVEQINSREDILPNITLGFDIYDTCADPNIAVRNSVNFIGSKDTSSCDGEEDRGNIVAVVGPPTSGAAVAVANFFNLFMLPQVSFAATSDVLSESRYTYFTRTVPTDTFQARAMATLAAYFDFQTVAVLANDDAAYGVSGSFVFEKEAAKRNICVAFVETFGVDDGDSEFAEIVRQLREVPGVRVIVAFAKEGPMVRLFSYLAKHNITGYIWIGSDGWGSSKIFEDPTFSSVARGMIGVYPHAHVIPEFDEYVVNLTPEALNYQDPFLNELWESLFKCKLPDGKENVDNRKPCNGTESFSDTYMFTNASLVSSVFDSVEVVARALNTTLLCTAEKCDRNLASVTGEILIQGMKNISFLGHSGYWIRPDESGNLAEVAWYDFYNLRPISPCSDEYSLMKVGEWRDDVELITLDNNMNVYWPSDDSCWWTGRPPSSVCGHACMPGTRMVTLDVSSCCWKCVPCSDNHYSNGTDALTCSPCEEDQISNDNRTACVNLPYSYTSPGSAIGIAALTSAVIGWLLCIFVVIVFTLKENTVIIFHAFARSWKLIMLGIMTSFITATLSVIPASDIVCLVVAATQLLPLSVTEASLIIVAYATYNRRHVHFNSWALAVIVVIFIHGLCILLWTLMSRPISTTTVDRSQRLVYVDCVSSGNLDGVVVIIAYALTLDLIGIFISFRIRNREKNFQEGKFILFSFITQAMMWTAILAIYLVLPEGRYYRTFVISFGIMISSTALIGCLFVPKLYVVRFKPGVNPLIKKRYRDKLWQWKFKRRYEDKEVPPEIKFGDSVRSHAARNAILENYRKALAAIQDETAQALRMGRICAERTEDMKLRHARKVDELTMSTSNLQSSRVRLVLSSPTVEVTYC